MSTADQGASSPTAHLFNPLFAQPEGSPIRELFPYLSRPGMLSLAGGYPSPSLFDAEGLQRSEEHTSELQSPCNLVCRLLLEKKKKDKRRCPIFRQHRLDVSQEPWTCTPRRVPTL